jgi:hypothetical protein
MNTGQNKIIHKWLGLHWHDVSTVVPRLNGSPFCKNCKKFWNGVNPDYSTESGFFALLKGLKAKGYQVRMGDTPNDDSAAGIQHWELNDQGEKIALSYDADAVADTLPAALCAATLKLIASHPSDRSEQEQV